MRKILMLLLLPALILTGCENYGKKIRINDTLEVYLKGDSVSEKEGRMLGDYFAGLFKGQTNEKSFQLSRANNAYEVRMVVDEKKLKADTTLDAGFEALKMLVSTQVFPGRDVKFIATDDHFKDIKTY